MKFLLDKGKLTKPIKWFVYKSHPSGIYLNMSAEMSLPVHNGLR